VTRTRAMSCMSHGSVHTSKSGRRLNLTLLESEGDNRPTITLTLILLFIYLMLSIHTL